MKPPKAARLAAAPNSKLPSKLRSAGLPRSWHLTIVYEFTPQQGSIVEHAANSNPASGSSQAPTLFENCPGMERWHHALDARAARRMIREVVEQHAPPGSVPSEEMVEPPFVREAEVLVKGILRLLQLPNDVVHRRNNHAQRPLLC